MATGWSREVSEHLGTSGNQPMFCSYKHNMWTVTGTTYVTTGWSREVSEHLVIS